MTFQQCSWRIRFRVSTTISRRRFAPTICRMRSIFLLMLICMAQVPASRLLFDCQGFYLAKKKTLQVAPTSNRRKTAASLPISTTTGVPMPISCCFGLDSLWLLWSFKLCKKKIVLRFVELFRFQDALLAGRTSRNTCIFTYPLRCVHNYTQLFLFF